LFILPISPTSAPAADGDLHLPRSSPAVDAGRNSLVDVPYDMEYKQRIVDGKLSGIPFVDMGAFEYYSYGINLPLVFNDIEAPS